MHHLQLEQFHQTTVCTSPTSLKTGLRVLEINFQNIMAKKVQLWNVIDAAQPDVAKPTDQHRLLEERIPSRSSRWVRRSTDSGTR